MNEGAASKTIYLIRHGAADGVMGRCIGHTDVVLSDEGRAQCAALALAWRPPAGSVLWCSDLARAHASARSLAESWGMTSTPLRLDAALRECAFGEWDGRTWADIESADAVRLNTWMRDWTTVAPPGGESLPMFANRVRTALTRIAESDGTHHVIVSHAGVLRAMLCHILGAPHSAAFGWAMPYARVSAVTVSAALAETDLVRGTVNWLNAFPPPSSIARA